MVWFSALRFWLVFVFLSDRVGMIEHPKIVVFPYLLKNGFIAFCLLPQKPA